MMILTSSGQGATLTSGLSKWNEIYGGRRMAVVYVSIEAYPTERGKRTFTWDSRVVFRILDLISFEELSASCVTTKRFSLIMPPNLFCLKFFWCGGPSTSRTPEGEECTYSANAV